MASAEVRGSDAFCALGSGGQYPTALHYTYPGRNPAQVVFCNTSLTASGTCPPASTTVCPPYALLPANSTGKLYLPYIPTAITALPWSQ